MNPMKTRPLFVCGTLPLLFLTGCVLRNQPSSGSHSLFPGKEEVPVSNEKLGFELGVRITTGRAGHVTAIRYFKSLGETGKHFAKVWSESGKLLASAEFTGETASGWQQVELITPLALEKGSTFIISVNDNTGGNYAYLEHYYDKPRSSGPLRTEVGAGIFNKTPGLIPGGTPYFNSSYFRDVVFETRDASDRWHSCIHGCLKKRPIE